MAVRRYDTSTIGAGIERTPQGGLRVPAYPTRTGVFEYLTPEGTMRREYRPPSEVFDPESLATLAHAPVTDLHPEANGVRIPVTPENYKELSVGHMAEGAQPQGDLVAATALIQDQGMIQQIEAGRRREMSCGYTCDLDPTPGVTPEGLIYDAIQRCIRYNHVALGPVGWGRAGASVALRLDSRDAIQALGKENSTVEKETIDGIEYVIGSEDWAKAKNAQAQKAMARADAAEKNLTQAQKELAAAKDPKTLSALIQRRVNLITDCKRIAKKAGARFDESGAAGMGEGDLLAQAIKLLDPSFDPSGKDPAYVAGYFEALVKGIKGTETAEGETEETMGGNEDPNSVPSNGAPMPPKPPENKTDSASIFTARQGTPANGKQEPSDPGTKARQDSIQRQNEAWKKPLASHK